MSDKTMPGPYKATKFDDFLADNAWVKDCEAFVMIGVGIDPDDKKNAKLNISNSEISHELLTYLTVAMMYHHNLKTDSQEIMIISKEREGT